MKIRLGYACVPVTIDETSSHSLTYTNYKKIGIKGNDKLDSVIKSNFKKLTIDKVKPSSIETLLSLNIILNVLKIGMSLPFLLKNFFHI